MHEIIIPAWHPLKLNELMPAHWSKRTRMKQSDYALIAHYGRHVPKATTKRLVQLTIVLGKGQRAGDPDSYNKVLLDGLVAAGLLKDDNRQGCELAPVQFERGEKATIIKLVDI